MKHTPKKSRRPSNFNYPKTGTLISIRKVRSLYTEHAPHILEMKDFLKEKVQRKRGAMRSYKILKQLPLPQDYTRIEDEYYTSSVEELVSGALGEFSNLKDELRDWYDNMPENFQNGEKGSALQDAIDALENITDIDFPQEVIDLKLTAVSKPIGDSGSRQARHDQSVAELETAIEALQAKIDKMDNEDIVAGITVDAERAQVNVDLKEKLVDLIAEIQTSIDEVQGVEYPSAY